MHRVCAPATDPRRFRPLASRKTHRVSPVRVRPWARPHSPACRRASPTSRACHRVCLARAPALARPLARRRSPACRRARALARVLRPTSRCSLACRRAPPAKPLAHVRRLARRPVRVLRRPKGRGRAPRVRRSVFCRRKDPGPRPKPAAARPRKGCPAAIRLHLALAPLAHRLARMLRASVLLAHRSASPRLVVRPARRPAPATTRFARCWQASAPAAHPARPRRVVHPLLRAFPIRLVRAPSRKVGPALLRLVLAPCALARRLALGRCAPVRRPALERCVLARRLVLHRVQRPARRRPQAARAPPSPSRQPIPRRRSTCLPRPDRTARNCASGSGLDKIYNVLIA